MKTGNSIKNIQAPYPSIMMENIKSNMAITFDCLIPNLDGIVSACAPVSSITSPMSNKMAKDITNETLPRVKSSDSLRLYPDCKYGIRAVSIPKTKPINRGFSKK